MDQLDFTGALVFTGGGTGGHFFPAVALAEGVRARWPQLPVVFVGARRGIEGRKLPASDWPHLLLDVEGLVGRSPLAMARAAWRMWRAKAALVARWKAQRPLAVIGTGGYGAGPALLAAQALGIPYFLHESNAAPGRLIRQVAPGAQRVWCGMDAVKALLPGAHCLTVGTPVREAFLREFRKVKDLKPPYQLLVLGGSGGARPINEGMMLAAPILLDQFEDWTVLHQTGAAEFERLKDQLRHPRHTLVPFIERMDEALEASSLVISRAGASTCAELKAAGRGAILIPFPGSAGDHQMENAKAMAREHRVILVTQQPNIADHLEAHAASHMAKPYPRIKLAKPEANRAVELCLDDLGQMLGLEEKG
jgi:UDP-N-acetylglucosamine--N-acetylmuramyl-(pentapeptide) pyrophosphoryl-undecaprenol N-acetylglucosamine transferase